MFLIAATQQTGKAQVLYGSIVGSVTDSSGAANPGSGSQSDPKGNVSNLQLNPDRSVKSLNGFAQITSVNPSSRTIDERYFRLGVHIKF
jgi:hypothetical protein